MLDAVVPIIIRRSAIFLFTKLMALEIIAVGIFLALRLPLHLFEFSAQDNSSIFSVYTSLYIGISIVKIFLIIWIILLWMNEYYEIIPGTLIHKTGIFSTSKKTFSLSNIETNEVKQSLFGGIFHFGSIEIYNPLLKQEFFLVNIPFPQKYLIIIQKYSNIPSGDKIKIIPLPA
jgi:uncharacterized membrane protein YdbT with pleckstrin-like domain